VEAERRQRGVAAYASQFGVPEEEVERLFLERFGRRFAEEVFHTAGDAWQDDSLSLRDRSLIVLAVLATQGGVESRLRPHVRWALEHGATPAELDALACLVAAYAGFPRASVALEAIRDELRLAGVPPDPPGDEPG
jgi:alkylhydroperoxidase/carboxymuconolactone decarboxylase family protein YurZ